ncbi:hypothetical protein DT603_08145 [Pseudoxanthomonas gei]|uniref:Uncharacterized protein n=1 Tax=Pseudoxanthomonas gei TaxID=1383030 RepID=A0ABX0AB73_9GAMM|nr:hypothetical protein [Pseudoxanthomonas gei]NDK38807.1 hypothetical protein [Pseudoxanthomonas gei]
METQPTYHSPRNAPPEQLQRMDLTFTLFALLTIRAFRAKIATETGRRVTLAMALDALIKSHPFAKPSGDSRSH